MKYFTKLLPVEGEEKRKHGSTVSNEVGKCLRENDGGFDYYQKVKLFLCSRDVQVGDKVFDSRDLSEELVVNHLIADDIVESKTKDKHYVYSHPNFLYKVIGEISPDALSYVKEGDEFDEDDWEVHTEYGGPYDKQLLRNPNYHKEIHIHIKGQCGHFH